MITAAALDQITGHTKYAERKTAFADVLRTYGGSINDPHELALFFSQVMHESGGMRHTKEIWGPTAAQRRYEGRTDLGNVKAGDGYKYRGRGYIQVTGRYNYEKLTAWIVDMFSGGPDFVKDPDVLVDRMNLGLGAIWYWQTRIDRKYIDAGNIEMITRQVNGGLNGYNDRLRYYDRAALVLLGYGADDVDGFQEDESLVVDGISGPKTRAAMHAALKSLQVTSPRKKLLTALFAAILSLFGVKK